MATITDAAGNIVLLRDDYTAIGTLGGLNAEVLLDVRGSNQVLVDLRTTLGALTVSVEGTVDGTNYVALPAVRIDTLAVVLSVVSATTLAVSLVVPSGGWQRIRLRVSAYTSGNIVAIMRGSVAAVPSLPAQLPPYPATLHVTATAAAGAAATLSLPAPGAGLRQYVTHVRLERFQAALGVAAATPVLVTTTNLPGAPVFSFSQRAAEQGAIEIGAYDYGTPLQAAAANTALTIVAPVQAQTLWRLSAHYYVAP